jgi:predicted metal-dependent hydrolase
MALASVVLGGFWIQATRALLAQDGMTLRDAARELGALRKAAEREGQPTMKPIFTSVFVRGIREYLRPSFHPNDKDHSRIVEDTLARLEAEGVVSADVSAAAE